MEKELFCSVLNEDVVLSFDGKHFELKCSETYILKSDLVDFLRELLLWVMDCCECEYKGQGCMKELAEFIVDLVKEVECREA